MIKFINMKPIKPLLILFLLFLLSPALTQDEIDLAFGGLIEGYLDDANPRQVFHIDGRRGEVIQFELRRRSGDLDPTLAVFDSSGAALFVRDDAAGQLHSRHRLTLPVSGRYFVAVGRFGHSLGATSGHYELRMTPLGLLSQPGSALRSGDSVTDTITDDQPQVYYALHASQGDILALAMTRASGSLDPHLQVLSPDRFVIADNDDQIGASARNARIDALIIKQTGEYIIIASRYGGPAGDTVGGFVLTVEEAENSGAGALPQAPLPIRYGETKQAALSHQQHQRFYTFNARQNDRVTISMSRQPPGQLDSYVILAAADYTPLIENDDGGKGQDALIGGWRIPADGKYHIIAARYDGQQGTTIGHYQLALESFGDVFKTAAADAISIRYGASIEGRIDTADEADLYVFHARQDDVIAVSMTRASGSLDPVVELLNSAQQLIMSDDDSGAGQDSLISAYAIPESGLYYIRARRYDGAHGDPDTAGAYALTLAQRFN